MDNTMIFDLDDALVKDSKNVIFRLVKEVQSLRTERDTMKASADRDTRTILTLRDELMQMTAENKIAEAESRACQKLLATAETKCKRLEIEKSDLLTVIDSLRCDFADCSVERRVLTEKLNNETQLYSLQAKLTEESAKYVNYIAGLEKRIVALNKQNHALKAQQTASESNRAKLEAATKTVSDLLQLMALEGFDLFISPKHSPFTTLLHPHAATLTGSHREGSESFEGSHLDCQLSTLRSTVEHLITTLQRSQQSTQALKNTIRLYEESTAFLDIRSNGINKLAPSNGSGSSRGTPT